MTFHLAEVNAAARYAIAGTAAVCLLGFFVTLAGHAQNSDKPELLIQLGHAFRISSLDFNKDGNLLASASWDNTVKIWDLKTGQVTRTLIGHECDAHTHWP